MKRVVPNHFFKMLVICIATIFSLQSTPTTNNLFSIFNRYERPITVLYISNNPQLLDITPDSVVVYWTQNAVFTEQIKKNKVPNAIVLTKEYDQTLIKLLAECEHFDVCILDSPFFFDSLCEDFHLADFTILLGESWLICKNKTLLKKNVWMGISKHENYQIFSDFNTKYFVKPKEYMPNALQDKVYNWKPGINLCTFIQLEGVYPKRQHIRTWIIELLNPYTHFDFSWGNIIVQGQVLRAIDFQDTMYGQNPNDRLRLTLVKQLNMIYD